MLNSKIVAYLSMSWLASSNPPVKCTQLFYATNTFRFNIHTSCKFIEYFHGFFFAITFPHEMAFNQVEFEFKLKEELDLREIFEFRVDFSIKNSLNRSKWLWIDLKIVGAKFKWNSIWSSKSTFDLNLIKFSEASSASNEYLVINPIWIKFIKWTT